MKNNQLLQAIVSAGAFICLLAGWVNVFPKDISELLYSRIFYVLIGTSFALMTPTLTNKKLVYPMYLCAFLCIVGGFLPEESSLKIIKTIGLFVGVFISITSRQRIQKSS